MLTKCVSFVWVSLYKEKHFIQTADTSRMKGGRNRLILDDQVPAKEVIKIVT